MRQSLKILEEERIVLKMKSVTNANKKDISSYIGKTSIPQSLEYHADSLNPMIMEDSLTGNMKFAELLQECDNHIHQIPAFPNTGYQPK